MTLNISSSTVIYIIIYSNISSKDSDNLVSVHKRQGQTTILDSCKRQALRHHCMGSGILKM